MARKTRQPRNQAEKWNIYLVASRGEVLRDLLVDLVHILLLVDLCGLHDC